MGGRVGIVSLLLLCFQLDASLFKISSWLSLPAGLCCASALPPRGCLTLGGCGCWGVWLGTRALCAPSCPKHAWLCPRNVLSAAVLLWATALGQEEEEQLVGLHGRPSFPDLQGPGCFLTFLCALRESSTMELCREVREPSCCPWAGSGVPASPC